MRKKKFIFCIKCFQIFFYIYNFGHFECNGWSFFFLGCLIQLLSILIEKIFTLALLSGPIWNDIGKKNSHLFHGCFGPFFFFFLCVFMNMFKLPLKSEITLHETILFFYYEFVKELWPLYFCFEFVTFLYEYYIGVMCWMPTSLKVL